MELGRVGLPLELFVDEGGGERHSRGADVSPTSLEEMSSAE